ncbi:CHD3-type chromatin-remodeling factor PICKLE [Quillaja saponaria]|uniref:CHD3-type chromatin-remodeling factor PICKLE n=1 Tax=Quillaja saponaria TaxID=32244 RepID=A0AAD7LI22_QUISA|nr:CHD3-type chromatin-remodeling factor PICKLE [Quillaja saponaria]
MRPPVAGSDEASKLGSKQIFVKQYLVKWKALSYLHCTWVPEKEFSKAFKSYPRCGLKLKNFIVKWNQILTLRKTLLPFGLNGLLLTGYLLAACLFIAAFHSSVSLYCCCVSFQCVCLLLRFIPAVRLLFIGMSTSEKSEIGMSKPSTFTSLFFGSPIITTANIVQSANSLEVSLSKDKLINVSLSATEYDKFLQYQATQQFSHGNSVPCLSHTPYDTWILDSGAV